jgi:hypothetical protein
MLPEQKMFENVTVAAFLVSLFVCFQSKFLRIIIQATGVSSTLTAYQTYSNNDTFLMSIFLWTNLIPIKCKATESLTNSVNYPSDTPETISYLHKEATYSVTQTYTQKRLRFLNRILYL